MENVYHYVKYVAIYLIFGFTMGWNSLEKLKDPVPSWFADQFRDTIVSSLPGLSVSWRLAGVLEVLVAVLAIVSLVRGEFLPGRRRTWLRLSLAVAAFDFMMLSAGQNLTYKFEGAASLFFYFGATMATLVVIHFDEQREALAGGVPLEVVA